MYIRVSKVKCQLNWYDGSDILAHARTYILLVMIVIYKSAILIHLQNQLVRAGGVQSTQSDVTLSDLETCNSYWAAVAVVNSCGVRRSGQSSPMLVGWYDVKNFELIVSLPSKPCPVWITEDTNTKIIDMRKRLDLAASTCGITIPCIVSSQWQCSTDDSQKARFSYVLYCTFACCSFA